MNFRTFSRPRVSFTPLAAAALALMCAGTVAQAQTIIHNFAGLGLAETAVANGGRYAPPDTNGAIGINNFVEFINGGYAVYDRNGARSAFTTDSQFWLNAGVSAALVNQGLSDTRIKYDPGSQRWFAAEITVASPAFVNNTVLLAVSKTSNPLDGWKSTTYNVAGATTFNDYPTLNIDANAVYIGSNDFTGAGNFKGVTLSSIPKSSLLGVAPTTAGIATFTQANAAMGFTPQGITNYGTGYTGSKVIAVSADAFNKVQVTAINNTGAAGATLGVTNSITVAHDGNGTLARQPNGSRLIDTLDDRISGTVQQVGNRIYATNAFNDGNQGSNTAPGFNSVHWMVIDATSGGLLQEGLLNDATHDYWQPSIAANENGDVVIGYNKSGANMNISSFAAIGHTVGGVLSFTDDVLLATSAVGNYTDGFGSPPSRWGDYSATMVDPTDSTVFWTIQELASDSRNFGTQITAIRVAAAVPEPETYALMLAGLAALGMVTRRRKAA